MPNPETGVYGPHPGTPLWTFDDAGNLYLVGQLYTGGAAADGAVTGGAAPGLDGGTLTGALSPAVATLAFGASIALDAALGNVFQVTLTASTGTLQTPAGADDGQPIRVRVYQDATGGRTLAYSSGWDFGAAGAPTLSTAAGALDYLVGEWNAAKGKVCVSAALGF